MGGEECAPSLPRPRTDARKSFWILLGRQTQAPHCTTDPDPGANGIHVFAACPDPLSRHRAGAKEGRPPPSKWSLVPSPYDTGTEIEMMSVVLPWWGSLQPQPAPEHLAPRIGSSGVGGPGHLCVSEPSRRRSCVRTSENTVSLAQKKHLLPGTQCRPCKCLTACR